MIVETPPAIPCFISTKGKISAIAPRRAQAARHGPRTALTVTTHHLALCALGVRDLHASARSS
jgi:hypothetical protein